MLTNALIGSALVVITFGIHGVGTTLWLRVLGRRYADAKGAMRFGKAGQALLTTVFVLLFLHIVEIVIWAFAYLAVLPAGELKSFEEAVYFSFVTYTTLGYGDITLTEGFRLLSGIEAMSGIMLAGWSTAMVFAVVQRAWHSMFSSNAPDPD